MPRFLLVIILFFERDFHLCWPGCVVFYAVITVLYGIHKMWSLLLMILEDLYNATSSYQDGISSK